MSERGVSSPLGVVLLLGITIASVTAIFAAGGAVLDDTRADAERSGVENSMAAFSSKASLVGLGESGDQQFSLGRISEGEVSVREGAGNVSIRIEDADGETTYTRNTTLGAVVYEAGDTEIAYQGGGVWERRGGASRMVSPPEYHYQLSTLTFPIITVRGEGRASGPVDGAVRPGAAGHGEAWFPNPDAGENLTNPLEQGTVLVGIESRYCEGWEAFFTDRSEGAVKEPCGDNRTVVVDLTVPFSLSGEEAVMAKNIEASGNKEIEGEEVVAPSVSPEVDDRIEACEAGGCEESIDGDTVTNGTYYLPDGGPDADTFDTSEGNITLVIDGDPELNEIDVKGNGTVTLYVRGDVEVSSDVNADGDARQFVVLVHSTGNIRFDGSTDFTGIIYAPKSDLTLKGGSAMEYGGAIVVEKFTVKGSSNFEFEPDPALEGYQLVGDDRPLTYLHVSKNPIEVDVD